MAASGTLVPGTIAYGPCKTELHDDNMAVVSAEAAQYSAVVVKCAYVK
jgi:hypothetical protein